MTSMGRTNTDLKIYQFENLKMKNELRFENCELKTDETGHTSLKLRAAGMETESPKSVDMCVDGLAVNSPAAAQKDLLIKTYQIVT